MDMASVATFTVGVLAGMLSALGYLRCAPADRESQAPSARLACAFALMGGVAFAVFEIASLLGLASFPRL
jgi:hypothetical protein